MSTRRMKTEETQSTQVFQDETAWDDIIGDNILLIDPVSILFEITFGFKLDKLGKSNLEAPLSKAGFNPILHIWM